MTVFYQLDLMMEGTPEQLASMLRIYLRYDEKYKSRSAYFSNTRINGTDLYCYLNGDNRICGDKYIERITGEAGIKEILRCGTVNINADGPFGNYRKLNDVNLFREMAEAVPDASFTAEITGGETYAQSSLKCILQEKKLKINTFYLSLDDEKDAELDKYAAYFKKLLPYRKFIRYFKIDSDSFDSEAYDGLICESLGENYREEAFADLDYDVFAEEMESFDAEPGIDEADYYSVMKNKIAPLNITSAYDYCEKLDIEAQGEEEHLIYDPIVKNYINDDQGRIYTCKTGKDDQAAGNEALIQSESNQKPESADAMKKVWFWETNADGSLIITSYKGNEVKIAVPCKIDNKNVCEIGEEAFSAFSERASKKIIDARRKITEVTVPEGISIIGKNAFSGCIRLEKVVLPETINEIDTTAFRRCAPGFKLVFPDSITMIELIDAGHSVVVSVDKAKRFIGG